MGAAQIQRNRAMLWAALLVATSASGCLSAVERYYEFDPDPQYKNPGVFIGNYSTSESAVLQPGPYVPGVVEVKHLVSDRPAVPSPAGEQASDATVLIPMAIWRPECPKLRENPNGNQGGFAVQPGEDPEEPEAVAVPDCPPIDGVRIPIIIDAGPYFETGVHCLMPATPIPQCPPELIQNNTIDWPGQLTPWMLKNFLPHGYAIVQLAVRGTGTHGGCMDLMGDDEQADLNQAITWLGQQPWSNGRIGMIGVSYDGSTPWTMAATGNEYLKTIVPISGLPDMFDLMFHNGSSETRGGIMHGTNSPATPFADGVYWGYGFRRGFLGVGPVPVPVPVPSPIPPEVVLNQVWSISTNPTGGTANDRGDSESLQNLICPDAYLGQATARISMATGSRASQTPYWVERDHRDDVLANYGGSVFLIHGLQDWNVDPHAAIPFNLALREKGLEVKEWYGQWDHNVPNGWCVPDAPEWVSSSCRLDFAEVLLRWWERQLKENMTVDVGPAIQVQDNVGQWRNVDSFPPVGSPVSKLHLTTDGALSTAPKGTPTATRLMPHTSGAPANIIEVRTPPLEEDLHISGMPQLDLPFQVTGEGGHLGVWMFDEDPDGNVRAPFAAMGEDVWEPVGLPVIGHASMNLLYHEGGEEAVPMVPGQTYVAHMEFEPLEVLVPKGHRLLMWVFQYAYPDRSTSMPTNGGAALLVGPQTMMPVDVLIGGEGSVLRLPTPDVDYTQVFPVPGAHFPDRELLEFMYVPKPVFPPQGTTLPVPLPGPPAGEQGSGSAAPQECAPAAGALSLATTACADRTR